MVGLPRSLRGRTLLLTVVGILACELVTFAVLGIYRHNLLAGRARDFVTGQIEMVRNALAPATPDQVAQELVRPPRSRSPGLLLPRDGAPRLQGRTRPRTDADDHPPADDDAANGPSP